MRILLLVASLILSTLPARAVTVDLSTYALIVSPIVLIELPPAPERESDAPDSLLTESAIATATLSASMLIESGLSPLRLQRWMGHHSPAFTIETYGHLIDGDLGPALDLRKELRVVQR